MRERESAAVVASGLLILIAALRMLAPALPFDWMTLVLVLAAAMTIVLPALTARFAPLPPPHCAPPETEPRAKHSLAPLEQMMREVSWQPREGGLFDALRAMHKESPFTALCAAFGSLAMLSQRAKVSGDDRAALSQLEKAIEQTVQAGEAATDAREVEALFCYALRALGMLDSM